MCLFTIKTVSSSNSSASMGQVLDIPEFSCFGITTEICYKEVSTALCTLHISIFPFGSYCLSPLAQIITTKTLGFVDLGKGVGAS